MDMQLLQLMLLGLSVATGVPALIYMAKALTQKRKLQNETQQSTQMQSPYESLVPVVVFLPKEAIRKFSTLESGKEAQTKLEKPTPEQKQEVKPKPLVERVEK